MSREKLRNRRQTLSLTVQHKNRDYLGSVSYFESGRVAEAFIQCGKAGTEIEALGRDTAVILSLALQYGCPLEILREAITREEDGTAAGPVGALLDKIEEPGPFYQAPVEPPEPPPSPITPAPEMIPATEPVLEGATA